MQAGRAKKKRRLGWALFSVPFGVGLALLLIEAVRRRQTSHNSGNTWQVCLLGCTLHTRAQTMQDMVLVLHSGIRSC